MNISWEKWAAFSPASNSKSKKWTSLKVSWEKGWHFPLFQTSESRTALEVSWEKWAAFSPVSNSK